MTKEEKSGYVYILTNPSFKDDWVKIGKSSRPVDVRSKELDNTAVPLPFEIYATLRTAKYETVEKKIHKQIDRLTDLRIRKGREFFNVQPSVALDILKDEASTLDDALIEIYKENKVAETINYVIEAEKADKEIFSCKGVDAYGEGYYVEESKQFVVLKGAVVRNLPAPSLTWPEKRMRQIDLTTTMKKGKLETIEDVVFSSTSKAAEFVLGRPANGWTEWKNKEGKTLDKVYRKK